MLAHTHTHAHTRTHTRTHTHTHTHTHAHHISNDPYISLSADPDHPPTTLDSFTIQAPHLEKLWTYYCPLTKKHSVTCLAWNPTNKVVIHHCDRNNTCEPVACFSALCVLCSIICTFSLICTCMQDILAVGYGAFNTEEQIGIICCWSLKNPEVCKLVWCQMWKLSTSLACVSVAFYPKE